MSAAKKAQTRNGKIEFLRFLFSVIIVIHHSRYLLGDSECLFLGGSLAVEFYFLVSGYLMMASVDRRAGASAPLGRETAQYLWRKVKSLLPELLTAQVIALVFISIAQQLTLTQTAANFIKSFFEVTLLKMTGLYSTSPNGVTWYISSMLLCMAVLYPLLRKFPDMMKHIVVPLAAVLLMGYLAANYGDPRDPRNWIGFTYKGNIRAMAELCLGVLCYLATRKIAALPLNRLGKALLSAAEVASYAAVIGYMYAMKASEYDYFFIAVLMVGVTASFSHQGLAAGWFDNRACAFLGKFSMPLFLSHTFYAQHLNLLLPEHFSNGQRMAVYLLCSFVTAAVVSTVGSLVRKVAPRVSVKLKTLLLTQ